MSFFDELENILSKAKAENSPAEDAAKDESTNAPLSVAVAVPADESIVSAPVVARPVATEVAPLRTAVPSIPTLAPRPSLELSPAISLAVPAVASEPVAPEAPSLPSRPSVALLDNAPKLSLAVAEPVKVEEEAPVQPKPSAVAASIAAVLPTLPAASKPAGLPPRPETLTAAADVDTDVAEDEAWEPVALPTVDSLVLASAPVLAAKAEVVSSDPENYIAAVSHAEDITVRTNSLPEIKPAGHEFFFEKDEEPVVF